MASDEHTDEQKARDYPALNALVEHLADFIKGMHLQDASQTEKARAVGIKHQRDFGKLMQKLHSPGLDKLQAIADKLEIEPWVLIRPIRYSESKTWPFDEVDQERYENLTDVQKGRVQQAMNDMLDKIEAEKSAKAQTLGKENSLTGTHSPH